ncbi:HpcH/HpaI aldolase/citrate lyase family protein [Halomarina oriensis]|uniref:CoA ester lyase n=1 Tax=Halomarina oriensis TaxID=671145 RepID=A0A6B0GH03_9EURY|nr:CoA ester lyase [Halomarina oriensis]MWG33237.1 CoA ester lyase [Halomarina oriensis]
MTRRSVLFSPGDRPKLMRKAPGTGADVVVFDLEDAVAPGEKEAGRAAVRAVLTDPAFDPDCEVCVRVSTHQTGADLDAVVATDARLDAVMLPKAESADQVDTLAAMLAERDADVPVFALCETATGVLHAEAIAGAEATTAVAFGAEDLSADIGANRTDEGTEVLYAREHVVLAASAAGVDAVDTVFTDIEDTDRLAEETAFARDLGYDGKMAIHPVQVPVMNEAFTPTDEQVAWARRVLDARDDHGGEGVFRVDGEMVDAPLITRAETVLARAGETNGETGDDDAE